MLTHLLSLFLGLTPDMPVAHTHSQPSYVHYHRGSHKDVETQKSGGFALMGGSTDVDRTFQWMSERGGNGDFLVLRGSGSDGYQPYIDEITDANSVDTIVIKDPAAASDPFVLEKVAKAEAIFFAGGDQWNYVGKWQDTPLLEALNKAILNQVPMGGTSAGLAILGEHVFTAEKGTITSPEALSNPGDEAITIQNDFLRAPPLEGLVTDTHFSERGRMGRLVTFMARTQVDHQMETFRGIGVDEKTVALVEPDGTTEVVGAGKAHFVQAGSPPEVCQEGKPLTHRELSVHSVAGGQHFHTKTWTSPEVQPTPMTVINGQLTGEP